MNPLRRFSYFRPMAAFLGVLVIALVAWVFLFLSSQKKALDDEARKSASNELELLSELILESLLKSDYINVEHAILNWGGRNEDIVSLKAVAANGFIVADYARGGARSGDVFEASFSVKYLDMHLLSIVMVKDLDKFHKALNALFIRNIALAAFFTGLMGVLLWYTLRRTALIPMEMLIREVELAREHLEERVADRTKELVKTNEELEDEIGRRSEAEAKLKFSESYLRSIFQSEPECVKLVAPDGTVLDMNPAGLRMVEADEPSQVIGQKVFGLILPEYAEAFKNTLSDVCSGKSASLEFDMAGFKGGRRRMFSQSVPFYDERSRQTVMLSVTRDITEYRKLEESYRHSQKMEALGTLTGGIAHEYNNIMTSIMGYTEFILDELPPDAPPDIKKYAKTILASAQRAGELTAGLLAYSRKQTVDLRPSDINRIISGIKDMLGRILSANVELRLSLSEEKLVVMADKAQMEQVFMNLVGNAVDAMPGGGLLDIRSDAVFLDEEFVQIHGFGAEGRYALVTVSDTGHGMDKATSEKIFEPFFTTKDIGKGTGLGLSMVYGIIRRHSGHITVYSEPEKGTTFKIYLPLTESAATVFPAENALRSAGKGERILLAEDDGMVRELIKSTLARAGYNVVTAVDGLDAIEKFQSMKESPDLLLFDVMMPRMDGRKAMDEILREKPGLKYAFISGYTPEISAKVGAVAEGSRLISKPVSPRELLNIIRETLDSA